MRNWPRGHKDPSVPAAGAAQLVGAVALTLVASILQGKPKGLVGRLISWERRSLRAFLAQLDSSAFHFAILAPPLGGLHLPLHIPHIHEGSCPAGSTASTTWKWTPHSIHLPSPSCRLPLPRPPSMLGPTSQAFAACIRCIYPGLLENVYSSRTYVSSFPSLFMVQGAIPALP